MEVPDSMNSGQRARTDSQTGNPGVPACLLCLVIMIVACAPSSPRLHQEIINRDTPAALASISESRDINTYSERGFTPLQLAVQTNQVDIIKSLIAAGADLDMRTIDGVSPLMIAIRGGHTDTARMLLASGAAINKLSRGNSPVFEAVKLRDRDLLALLLDSGGDVNFRDHGGATPLIYAAYLGYTEIASFLVGRGADIDARTDDGRSALHAAVYRNNTDIADMLMDAGATISGTKQSEEGIYASARLYRYAALRVSRDNDDLAARYLDEAIAYYDQTTAMLEKKVNELNSEIFEQHMLSVASFVVAGISAEYQAHTNLVMTPDGRSVGIGVAQYNIRDTSDLDDLVDMYANTIAACRDEAARLRSVHTCSAGMNSKLNGCFSQYEG